MNKNNSANTYLFKVNSRNNRKCCEICSKLTIKTPETSFTPFSSVSVVDFEQANVSCEVLDYSRNFWSNLDLNLIPALPRGLSSLRYIKILFIISVVIIVYIVILRDNSLYKIGAYSRILVIK